MIDVLTGFVTGQGFREAVKIGVTVLGVPLMVVFLAYQQGGLIEQ